MMIRCIGVSSCAAKTSAHTQLRSPTNASPFANQASKLQTLHTSGPSHFNGPVFQTRSFFLSTVLLSTPKRAKRKLQNVVIKSHNKNPYRMKVPRYVKNEKGEIVPEKARGPNSTLARRKKFIAEEEAKQSSVPAEIKDKLRLVAASIIERGPVVLPPLEPLEVEYWNWKEETLLARKKLRAAAQEKRLNEWLQRERERGKKSGGSGGSSAFKKPSLQELEAKQRREIVLAGGVKPQAFRLPTYTREDLITKDDRSNNRKSLYRNLTGYLYLIVKKNRAEHTWQFPQGGWDKEVDQWHLRNTAKRETSEEVGSDLKLWWLGHCPVGWWEYEYPKEAQQLHNAPGAKVFFYKAHYCHGQPVVDNKEVVDYLWVTKEELGEYLEPKFYTYIKDVLF